MSSQEGHISPERRRSGVVFYAEKLAMEIGVARFAERLRLLTDDCAG